MSTIIGREKEIAELKELYKSDKSEFVKVSMCNGAIEYDLRDGGTKIVKKFNKNLQKAVKHVTKLPSKIRYEEGWNVADSRFSFVPGTSTYTY